MPEASEHARDTVMTAATATEAALRDARPVPFWTDRPVVPAICPPAPRTATCDVLVVGGGFTGLWAAIEAVIAHPSADVMLVESREIASGASSRNGGIISDSLTSMQAHPWQLWPREVSEVARLGRENLREICEFVDGEGIDAGLSLSGASVVATLPHHLDELQSLQALAALVGEDVDRLDADQMRADIHSPSYLGGLRHRSGRGLVDPAALAWGLKSSALRRGVRIHENTAVTAIRSIRGRVEAATDRGSITAKGVVLATNAYPALVPWVRHRLLPVLEHVLVTEPLTDEQRQSLGWGENQGVIEVGPLGHYCRRTPDDRILWGGQREPCAPRVRPDPSHRRGDAAYLSLARHFARTFPQLEQVRFTHRWAGLIDATSRMTPVFGTAYDQRVAFAVGFGGAGVAASRFGARVALDLLAGLDTERTRLEMVRRPPRPIALRNPVVRAHVRRARENILGGRDRRPPDGDT